MPYTRGVHVSMISLRVFNLGGMKHSACIPTYDRAIRIGKMKVWPFADQPRRYIKFGFSFQIFIFFHLPWVTRLGVPANVRNSKLLVRTVHTYTYHPCKNEKTCHV